MSTSSQRGRKVQRRKASLLPFYIGIGVVAAIGLVFAGLTYFNRDTGEVPTVSGVEKTTISAPVGKTDDGFWYKGDPNAPVKVVEFADYQCPGCANFSQTLGKDLTQKYVETGQVQFIYHDFPLQQHAQARLAATAARCAGEQGDYWSMHDVLFKRQNEWADNRRAQSLMIGYAVALGMDQAAFEQCLTSNSFAAEIETAVQTGVATGVPATPSFTVNGKLVSRDQLEGEIQAVLGAQ